MRFCLGKCVALIGATAVMLFCSCEKHQVGEIPEVQKEHVDPAKAAPEHQAQPVETPSQSR